MIRYLTALEASAWLLAQGTTGKQEFVIVAVNPNDGDGVLQHSAGLAQPTAEKMLRNMMTLMEHNPVKGQEA